MLFNFIFLMLPTSVAAAESPLISLASLWCSSGLAVALTSLVNPALSSSPAGYATVMPSFFQRGDCSAGSFENFYASCCRSSVFLLFLLAALFTLIRLFLFRSKKKNESLLFAWVFVVPWSARFQLPNSNGRFIFIPCLKQKEGESGRRLRDGIKN